ncbi:hypothetical protein [Haloactinomyces albus]|uniref:Uncharacterized protein n=1 Tax=Haloactinomyces albus TaxID=1352928 RepID=A0AAE3ZCH1_9ACTN|nr:hypothetical protein [Haloactinomyces albus]MDR7301009.1 hypothetical protein [Haloactinomyces albus]
MWAPFIMAASLAYAAYFVHGVLLAGTIAPLEDHFQHGEEVRHHARISALDEADVGRLVPVYDTATPVRGRVWKPVAAGEPAVLGQILIGPLAIAAFCFWYFFLARTVLRGIALAVHKVRGPKRAKNAENTADRETSRLKDFGIRR